MSTGRFSKGDTFEKRGFTQHRHGLEAGTSEALGVLFVLNEYGGVFAKRSSHRAVGGHIDVVGMHVRYDVRVDPVEHRFERHRQIAKRHR